MTAVLVAAGAFLGAPLRYYIAHHLDRVDRPSPWPSGTLLVNLLGSFLLGWASALALSEVELAFLAVGFCGAFTTYSSFAVQTVDLGLRRGASYAVITVVGCLGAAILGFTL